jgi:hypothetical protein
MTMNRLPSTRWTDWESGILLLAIDWYTVGGRYYPVYAKIGAITRDWAETLAPSMDPRSIRIGTHAITPRERAFDIHTTKARWRKVRKNNRSRSAAIQALFEKVLPFRELIESTYNVSISYVKCDRLPAITNLLSREVEEVGIITEYAVAGWRGESVAAANVGYEYLRRCDRARRDAIYKAADRETRGLVGEDGTIIAQGPDAPQWLKNLSGYQNYQPEESPTATQGFEGSEVFDSAFPSPRPPPIVIDLTHDDSEDNYDFDFDWASFLSDTPSNPFPTQVP